MNRTIRLVTLSITMGFVLTGRATPPAVTGQEEKPTSPKEKLDEAFNACEEAPHTYFALCDIQRTADKARMAAQDEVNSSPVAAEEVRAKYLKTVADEDKAFADMKVALDEWSAAIARLKVATEDYKNASDKIESVVMAAMSAVESQEKEHHKNLAQYQQGLQGWEKQRPRSRETTHE